MGAVEVPTTTTTAGPVARSATVRAAAAGTLPRTGSDARSLVVVAIGALAVGLVLRRRAVLARPRAF
jgi:LPXTG-motif cell wall-anchored protein